MASGSLDRERMYWAVAWATRRTLPYVKSSAMIPRQPSVPNLICCVKGFLKVAGLAGPLESIDDLANVLCARAGTHEQRIFGVDDDHVLEPDRSHQPAAAEDKTAGGVDEHRFALDRISVRVGPDTVAQLGPVADVGPIELRGDEKKSFGLLHDAAIDDLHGKAPVQVRRLVLMACSARSDDLLEPGQVPRCEIGR